jgi:hypothetical protein
MISVLDELENVSRTEIHSCAHPSPSVSSNSLEKKNRMVHHPYLQIAHHRLLDLIWTSIEKINVVNDGSPGHLNSVLFREPVLDLTLDVSSELEEKKHSKLMKILL